MAATTRSPVSLMVLELLHHEYLALLVRRLRMSAAGFGGVRPSVPPTPTAFSHSTPAYRLQLRTHDDGRLASEEMFAKLELAGFTVGKRFAER